MDKQIVDNLLKSKETVKELAVATIVVSAGYSYLMPMEGTVVNLISAVVILLALGLSLGLSSVIGRTFRKVFMGFMFLIMTILVYKGLNTISMLLVNNSISIDYLEISVVSVFTSILAIFTGYYMKYIFRS